MTILEETILFTLSQVKKLGKENLSKIELFKLIYLIEVESYRFVGESFFNKEVLFARYENGPISVDIYKAIDNLKYGSYIEIKEEKKDDWGEPRHSIYLKKELKKTDKDKLKTEYKMFINSVLSSYGKLSIKSLKKVVYETEPMVEVQKKETKGILKGFNLNFGTIPLDNDFKEVFKNG